MSIFSDIYATITEETCGEACWHAREDICRCSCAGENHGCLRTKDGTQPVRMSRIDGIRYKLLAVGPRREVYDQAETLCDNWGYKKEPDAVRYENGGVGNLYVYWFDVTDKGAPARLKRATEAQLAKWPELAAYKNARPFEEISLAWVREDFSMENREPMPYEKWLAIGRHLWLREHGWRWNYPDIRGEAQEALRRYDAGWRWEDEYANGRDAKLARLDTIPEEAYTGA